jgi:uncharacterized membrane protein YkoI
MTILLLAFAGAPSASLAQGGCVSRGEDRQLIEAGQVVSLSTAMQQAGVSGEVVEMQLCRAGGGYVYRGRVREQNGEVRAVNIPAG